MHGCGQGLTAVAVARLPLGPAALTTLFGPVLSVLLAWPLLGEAPTLGQVAGGAAILFALAVARPRG